MCVHIGIFTVCENSHREEDDLRAPVGIRDPHPLMKEFKLGEKLSLRSKVLASNWKIRLIRDNAAGESSQSSLRSPHICGGT